MNDVVKMDLEGSTREMPLFSFVTHINAQSGELLDWQIVRQGDLQTIANAQAPRGILVIEQSCVRAPSETDALVLFWVALMTERGEHVERFWHRVRTVPRIRVAAIRRMGMRALGPVLNGFRHLGTSGGPS
jgi:hypothetical protein